MTGRTLIGSVLVMERGQGATSVQEYFELAPPDQAAAIRLVFDRIKAHVPDAGEHFAYGIPIVDYRGKGLVGVSVATKHCSLHLMSPPAAKALKDGLTEGKVSGATVQFPASAPLSDETIRLIVEHRIAEVDARMGGAGR